MRIGILEDDIDQQVVYKAWLEAAQHDCACFGTAREFIQALQSEHFDLLLLDWMLPDTNGDVVLRWIREHLGWNLPVIFVTSRDSEADIVHALRNGADDYVVKPPRHLELLARVESLCRRTQGSTNQRLGDYEIRHDQRRIDVNGQPADLTQKEFELACYMFEHAGELLSRVHLLDKIWGLNASVDTRTVDTHVSRLRRKLSITPEHGWQITPIYGYGYRIERTTMQ